MASAPERQPVALIPLLLGAAAGAALAAAGLAGLMLWQRGATQPGGFLPHADAEVVAMGADIYAAHCAACHGAALEGEPDWATPGLDGRLPAPPHDADGHTWHHPDRQLFAMTRDGMAAVVGPDYESNMPAFGDILSDAEIIAVLAFIKSRWPEEIRLWHDDLNRRSEAMR